MDIVVIFGVDSDGIFVDVLTEGIDPDVVRVVCVFGGVVAVLDALIMVGFVVVVMVAVVGGVVDAEVVAEVVVVVGVVAVVGDAVDGFGTKPEIRKNISNYS